MRSRLLSLALPLVALFVSFSPSGHATTVQNRITSSVVGNSRVPLEHAVPFRALRSSDLGPAAGNRALTNLSLRFSMTAAQQADLTQLLSDQVNPSSPRYHHWLTPEEFGARYGLSSSDLAKVASWLTSQGFTVTETARSSTFINFTGTVAQVQNAFSTNIHRLSFNGEQHISNLTNPSLPSTIADVVSSIGGLHDFRVRPRSRATRVKVNPNYTANGSAACGTGVSNCFYIAPGDFYTIYNVTPLLNRSTPIDGTGITIAIMGQTALLPAQVTAFRTAAGLPANAPTIQTAGSNPPGIVTGDIDEASLDVEWSGAVAPNAKIVYVYGQDVFLNSLTQTINSAAPPPIISISYGICESQVNTFYNINTMNQLLQQANAEGITVIGAAGDSGATDCDSAGLASEGLAVDFPASSPYATSAGGTQFSGDVNNTSAYWNNSNTSTPYTHSIIIDPNNPNAPHYIPESPWNETTVTGGLSDGGAGGGGASAYFSKPAWQVGAGVPNDGSRDVPDFSLNSGAIHDGTIVCSQGDCTNGFLTSTGSIDVFGGTSVAAPTFAGMLALVEQNLGGTRLGNVGPNLYGLASVANVFHDITSGNNKVYCIQGTPNCTNGGPIGFNAGVGYDQATGLGSIDANMLVTNWASGVPTGTGGTNQSTPLNSATALTVGSAVCGLAPGGSLTFTATVTNASGASGATPQGNVQFMIDNVAAGGPVALSSGGVATFTLVNNATLALTSGGHNVTAIYMGSATYSGSKGSLLANSANTGIVSPIDVVSVTQPDFSITPCTTSAAVASGSSASPVVLTITPFNGYTGSVNFAVSTDSGDIFNTAFSVRPVVISGAAGVTTSFVLTATETTTTSSAAHLKPGAGHTPPGRVPWYAAGSGATLACLVLFVMPRRRRWGVVFALMLSVAAIGAVGCGSSSTTVSGGGGGGGGGGTTTTPAPRGTYNLTITATSGSLVHSSVITYTVQ